VKIENGYYVWTKGEAVALTNNFGTAEFECKCKRSDCVEQRISVKLVDDLQWLREATKSSLRVHSGYRCPAHNKAVGGAPKSQHPLANAADVSSSALSPLELRKTAEHRFKAIGTASNFLHLDTRSDKQRRWNY
jgi:zinc D-Ala-D-Ala carboxypeptidase